MQEPLVTEQIPGHSLATLTSTQLIRLLTTKIRDCVTSVVQRTYGVGREGIIELTEKVLADDDFLTGTGSGSPDKHHYGKHGLLLHTWEVLNGALALFDTQVTIENHDVLNEQRAYLMVAALCHDVGKTLDYAWSEEQEKYIATGHHKYQRHLVNSVRILDSWRYARIFGPVRESDRQFGITPEGWLQITHAMLAHHGTHAAGSPVEPKTMIAHALHAADKFSAYSWPTRQLR